MYFLETQKETRADMISVINAEKYYLLSMWEIIMYLVGPSCGNHVNEAFWVVIL